MRRRRIDLADLLTASGAAMATSNQRLERAGAPALLREFTVGLDFLAAFSITPETCTVLFRRVAKPDVQFLALGKHQANVKIEATYIAAPGIRTGSAEGAPP